MGNRAVITTANALNEDGTLKGNELGIYVHWYGDKKVVESFLKDAKEAGIRNPEYDSYGWARLCQLIANKLDSDKCIKGTGIGIDILDRLDCNNGDNGVYFIKDWKIVGRMYNPVED